MKYRVADKVKVKYEVAKLMFMIHNSVYVVVKTKQITFNGKPENFYCLRDDSNKEFCWLSEEELISIGE